MNNNYFEHIAIAEELSKLDPAKILDALFEKESTKSSRAELAVFTLLVG